MLIRAISLYIKIFFIKYYLEQYEMVILVGQKVVKYQLLQMVQPNINASVLGENLEQYLM